MATKKGIRIPSVPLATVQAFERAFPDTAQREGELRRFLLGLSLLGPRKRREYIMRIGLAGKSEVQPILRELEGVVAGVMRPKGTQPFRLTSRNPLFGNFLSLFATAAYLRTGDKREAQALLRKVYRATLTLSEREAQEYHSRLVEADRTHDLGAVEGIIEELLARAER